MTAAAQLACDRVSVSAVYSGFIDAAMLRSADQGRQLAPLEGSATPGAATPAEIASYAAFSNIPRPRKSHAGGRVTATRWVDVIVALYTRAVA
jgi:hypothetical protein